jgi:general secretion pathway protein J
MCSDINYHFPTPTRKCPAKGYTLIEVLVAMAIFTSMLVLAGMALNQGLRQYHGLVARGLGFWDHAKKIWIDKSFNSTVDYYVNTRSNGWFPYFKGNSDSVSYVSLAPFADEVPVVVWIKSETQENGKSALRYYELPVYAKTFEDIDRDEVFGNYKKGKSFNLLTDVEGISFEYYGCSITDRQCRWLTLYDGGNMKMLPLSVKIEYKLNGEKGSFLFDIHVNSRMKMHYNELYYKQ